MHVYQHAHGVPALGSQEDSEQVTSPTADDQI